MEEAPVASWNASKIFPTSIRYLEYAPLRHGGLRGKFSCPDLSGLLCVKLGFQLYCRRIDVERSHAAASRGMFCSSLFTCSLSRHNSHALWTETLLSRCFFAAGKHSANSLERGWRQVAAKIAITLKGNRINGKRDIEYFEAQRFSTKRSLKLANNSAAEPGSSRRRTKRNYHRANSREPSIEIALRNGDSSRRAS